ESIAHGAWRIAYGAKHFAILGSPRRGAWTPRKNFSLKEADNSHCLSHYTIYKTGDLAKWLPDGNIEFLGRIDHQVKIRGFRIELGEIENRLLTHDRVKETVVLAQKDKNGDNYLCAYIVSDSEHQVPDFREFLLKYLPDYMVPSYFVQIQNIPLNPNGKVDQKALPAPVFTTAGRYIPPGNEVEKKLVEIWSEILTLKKEEIGIDANFLQLGGHSLKAHYVAAKIHKTFDVTLPLVKVFEIPTIRGLARYIEASGTEKYEPIKAVEEKEYYLLTPAQKRLYILQQMELESIGYNMPQVLPLREEVDLEQLEKAIKKLISRHESLRTSFQIINEEPFQEIHDQVELAMAHYDLRDKQENQAQAAAEIVRGFVKPFDLSEAPLLRVGLICTTESRHLFLLDMHHIITDGTSQAILKKELLTLYSGKELPPLPLQYKDYAWWQNSGKQQELIKHQETHWLSLFSDEIPVLNLPNDYPRPLLQSFAGRRINFVSTEEETKHLTAIAEENGSTLYMIILSLFNILLAKLSGEEDIIVGTPIAGRLHPDAESLVGMFVNTLPMRNYPQGSKTFKEFLQEVKKHTLDAYENQAYPFDQLVEKISVSRDTSRNPVFDVMFNLLNQDEYTDNFSLVDEGGMEYYENVTAKFDLNLAGMDLGETLQFSLEYCKQLFKKETIKKIIKYFKRIVRAVITNPEQRLSKLEILCDEEKAEILRISSGKTGDTAGHCTIHQWFEEMVKKVPENTALVWGETWITYDQLNKKADRLARILRLKGITADTVVCLMVERSIEMIVGIMGILKAGGAYLPIDPEYPEKRINYMLADSGTKVLVTTNGLSGDRKMGRWENRKNIEIVLLDSSSLPGFRAASLPRCPTSHPFNLAYVIYTSGTTGKPKGVMVTHQNVTNLVLGLKNRIYVSYSKPLAVCVIAPYVFDASVKQIFAALLLGHSLYIVPAYTGMDGLKLTEFYMRYNIDISDGTPTHLRLLLENINRKEKNVNPEIKHFIIGGEELPREIAKNFINRFGPKGLAITNVYGPTECCVDSTSYDISKEN
ncbi:MAG: AMP-binding protein, partial [Candidatus Aminicenantes bacterium]